METDIYSRCRQLGEKFKEHHECAPGDKGSAIGSLADLIWDVFPDNYQTDPQELKPFQEYKLHCIRVRSRNVKDSILDWLPYFGQLMWKKGIANDGDAVNSEEFIVLGTLLENLAELFKVCEDLQGNAEGAIESRIEWEADNPEFAMPEKESVCATFGRGCSQ